MSPTIQSAVKTQRVFATEGAYPVGQRGARRRGAETHVKLPGLIFGQTDLDVTQGLAPEELGKSHRTNQAQSSASAGAPSVSLDDAPEGLPRHGFRSLRKQRLAPVHATSRAGQRGMGHSGAKPTDRGCEDDGEALSHAVTRPTQMGIGKPSPGESGDVTGQVTVRVFEAPFTRRLAARMNAEVTDSLRDTAQGTPSPIIAEMKLNEATSKEDPRERLKRLRDELAARPIPSAG